jgi:Ca2+-binding EF-hand superfamily protein
LNHFALYLIQEFVAVMSRKVNASYTPEEVKAAFKVFEGTCPPGHVKLATLQRALATYGSDKLTAEQAAELLNQVEVDQNGLFCYSEYVNQMMS